MSIDYVLGFSFVVKNLEVKFCKFHRLIDFPQGIFWAPLKKIFLKGRRMILCYNWTYCALCPPLLSYISTLLLKPHCRIYSRPSSCSFSYHHFICRYWLFHHVLHFIFTYHSLDIRCAWLHLFMQCHVITREVMLFHVMSYYVMLWYILSCYIWAIMWQCVVMLCHDISCVFMLCYVLSCVVMIFYVMLWCIMFCKVMLWYIMSCYGILCYVLTRIVCLNSY